MLDFRQELIRQNRNVRLFQPGVSKMSMTLSDEMARETICRTAKSNSSGDFPPPSLMQWHYSFTIVPLFPSIDPLELLLEVKNQILNANSASSKFSPRSVIFILCFNAAMYADGHLTAFEDGQLQKLLAGMGFTEESNRQREFDAAVTRIRPAPHHFLVAVPALWADDWKHDE